MEAIREAQASSDAADRLGVGRGSDAPCANGGVDVVESSWRRHDARRWSGQSMASGVCSRNGQILYARRKQCNAVEHSDLLGFFTQTATARGRSRSCSNHGASSVSRTDSDQRRPLLLPQEFKELGPEREVLIVENCKPVLASKLRDYNDSKLSRLGLRLLPPAQPPLIMVRHRQSIRQGRRDGALDDVASSERFDAIGDELARGQPDAGAEPVFRRLTDFLRDDVDRRGAGGERG